MNKDVYRKIAWIWIIIVGGLMITPDGIFCIVCGPLLTQILGIASIIFGVAGFVLDRRAEGR